MKSRDVLAVFNRGRISRKAVARTDVSRVALSAETQTNWSARSLGPMDLRCGTEHLDDLGGDGRYIPFVYSVDDKAIIDVQPTGISIYENGADVLFRPLVSATVQNGFFTSGLTGWTDADDAGATSSHVAGDTALGVLRLLGDGVNSARRRQQVTVSNPNVAHALRVVIERGPVLFRVGAAAGLDDVFRQAVLETGTHSLAFTPTGDFHIEFSSYLDYPVWVQSCTVEGSGRVSLPSPWKTIEDINLVRTAQSGDVVFCACDGHMPYRIERRPNGSWSVVQFEPRNGPFLVENVEAITLRPDALSGRTQMHASQPLFTPDHVGALFKVESFGQRVQQAIASETFTDPIRVVGVTDSRKFTVRRTGTWMGTVTLQRSVGAPGSWTSVETYGSNGENVVDDGLDNSITYYRLGFESGDYTSGTAVLELEFPSGSITGIARVVDYVDETEVGVVALKPFGGTDPSDVWAEGAWSPAQCYPEAVTIYEGRAMFSAKSRVWGSVSDAFSSFSSEVEGDSGPINRRVGEATAHRSNWLLPLQRLIAGTDSGEYSVRSTSFDEPLTQSNYNAKMASSKGSDQVAPASIDGRGYFVGRDGVSLYEMNYDAQTYDFAARQATVLCPEVGESGMLRIAAQQHPEMRVHVVRGDGTVGVMVRDPAEDVQAWEDIETDGVVTDVCVLPDREEDRIFYRVKRIGGGEVRHHHERVALRSECQGGVVNKIMDNSRSGTSQNGVNEIANLDHLNGRDVIVWGDGDYVGEAIVADGRIAVPETLNSWTVGLPYTALYKSAKLAGQTGLGLSLTQLSRIDHIGLILEKESREGLEFGPDFEVMDELPETETFSETMIEFPGEWSADNRVCLRAQAPYPCTVLAAVLSVDRQDKA